MFRFSWKNIRIYYFEKQQFEGNIEKIMASLFVVKFAV
jgi:hypothetical protein